MITLARLQTEIRTALARFMSEHPLKPAADRAAALAPVYPALRRLAGEEGLAWLAAVAGTAACLEPAARLPWLLRTDRRLRALAYVADLADIEWAMQTAWTAPLAPKLDAAALATVPTERLPALVLRRQAGWSLVASSYPVLEIWRACQADGGKHLALCFAAEPTRLLIGRAWSELAWLRLTCSQLQLLRQLDNGRTLGAATSGIRPAETGRVFDFLAGLVDRGVFMQLAPGEALTAPGRAGRAAARPPALALVSDGQPALQAMPA